MAKINLLPWREERREQLKQEFITNLVLAAVFAGFLLALAYTAVNAMIDGQQERNRYLQTHINDLNEKVKEIADLNTQRETLIERMNIIQGLQGNRPVIVRIFDQFVRTLPDGLYYTKMVRKDQKVEIEGSAESNNRVSTLMRELDKSDWFYNPNLTEVTSNPDFGEQANNFSLTIDLTTPNVSEEEE